jgi:hypothetical protein
MGTALFDELSHLLVIPFPLLGSGTEPRSWQMTTAGIQHARAEVPAPTL